MPATACRKTFVGRLAAKVEPRVDPEAGVVNPERST